jgi:hypothetical protein
MNTNSDCTGTEGEKTFDNVASCPHDDTDCECGRTLYHVINGVATPVNNQCTDGCLEPDAKILFSPDQLEVLHLMEGCYFWRCCTRPHSEGGGVV